MTKTWQKSIKMEIEEIQKHRRRESKRVGYDIGSHAAALDWIEKYAADFRTAWEIDQLGEES
jgi:hypothetical protein